MKRILLIVLIVVILLSISCKSKVTEIKIGVLLPLTGELSHYGKSTLNGIQLAVEQYNKQNTPIISLEIIDNKGNDELSRNGVTKLKEKNVIAIIGPITSSNTINASLAAQKCAIPQIVPAATHVLATRYSRCSWRICYTDDDQGNVMAHFAYYTMDLKKSYNIVDTSNIYSKGLEMYFQNTFESTKGKVVEKYYMTSGKYDLTQIANRIRHSGAEFVFMPLYHTDTYKIIKGLRKLGIDKPILGSDGWDSPLMYEKGFNLPGNNYFCTHFFYKTENPFVKEFVESYKVKFNTIPNSLSALGYDAISLIIYEIKNNKTYNRSALLTSLISLESFSGVTGSMRYNKRQDPIKGFFILKISNDGVSLNQRIEPSM
jgi:branched-chain amino acid transport system substrate-binding protein